MRRSKEQESGLQQPLEFAVPSDENSMVISNNCLSYVPPESKEARSFSPGIIRKILDGDSIETLDEMYQLFKRSPIFWTNQHSPGRTNQYTSMDYNSTKEEQREITFRRILFLRDLGYFSEYLTSDDRTVLSRKGAMHEALGIYDHSLGVKLGVHIHLWGGAIKFLGTKRHHEKWLKKSEDYAVAGCFGLTELGHGSNVRGIETVATYDARERQFIIHTPSETAQKYWIGGAALHANHTVAFAQLYINGKNEGVHAFIVPIRDAAGQPCPGVRIADCGHKIGLNGVDNGRIWFDKVRIPRENLLNAVADVTPDGQYQSAISDPDQRFAAFMAPLTGGRVTIAVSAVNQCKIGLSIALRFALSRRAFSIHPDQEEVLLLDYPSHQRRLLPLLAKTYAMNFACNDLKKLYYARTPSDAKTIHVQSSGYKAMSSWHMLRTLQECREACGGQGVSSENRIGQLKAEHDVMATFEGDNNVLMQTVSKAILAEYMAFKRKGVPLKSLDLQHVNAPPPILPTHWDSTVLRSTEFQLKIMQLRERDLLERFHDKVTQHLDARKTLAEALNESYQIATDLGRAHAEREALQAMIAAIQGVTDMDVHDVLTLLCALNTLATIDEDPVFLRYGYLSSIQSQVIHAEVAKLCNEVRPHTLGLVEAFGLPPHLLGPIAFDWVAHNSWKYADGNQYTVHKETTLHSAL